MKVSTTMTEKEEPAVIIQTPERAPVISKEKKKTYAAIAVAAVVVAVVVVTGFVLTFHFYSKSTNEIIKHKLSFVDNDGKEVQEDVEADMTENVAYMKMKRGEQTHHIVHDFNRKIALVKVETDQGSTCYLSALNTTASLASSVLADNGNDQESDDDENGMVYVTDPQPVTTLSFLSPKAQALCGEHPTHWTHPTCTKGTEDMVEEDGVANREKRATVQCKAGCCYLVCCRRITYFISWVANGRRQCRWGCQGFVGYRKHSSYC